MSSWVQTGDKPVRKTQSGPLQQATTSENILDVIQSEKVYRLTGGKQEGGDGDNCDKTPSGNEKSGAGKK